MLIMELLKIKPSLIKVPEVRVTSRFNEETRQLLRDSIKEVGVVAPVLVQKIDGELVLIDGLHRTQEAIANGDNPIDVAVLEGDMTTLLCRNLFLDHARGKTPVSEITRVIGVLYTEYGLAPDKIKEKTGLTRNYIEKLVRISQASPSVQEALDNGIIGVGHAFELSRLPHAIQQDELIAKQQVYRFKVSEVKDFVDQVIRDTKVLEEKGPPGASTEPRTVPAYSCEGCKQEVQARFLRAVMLCPECFGGVWNLAKLREPNKEESQKNPEGG